jgi:hypothetical protein
MLSTIIRKFEKDCYAKIWRRPRKNRGRLLRKLAVVTIPRAFQQPWGDFSKISPLFQKLQEDPGEIGADCYERGPSLPYSDPSVFIKQI